MAASLNEWWVQDGINFLKGIPGDAFNPPMPPPTIDQCSGEVQNLWHGANLSDEFIVCFLRSVPAARDSFCRMIKFCSIEEQARLYALWDASPILRDPKADDDALMANQNQLGPLKRGPGPLLPGDPRKNGMSW